MRPCFLLLTVLVILVGCKPDDTPAALQLVRTLVADPKSIGEDRHAIGEVKPRYESDVSFRVAGKVLSRRVDVGAWVKQGDTLASLDTQDYRKSPPLSGSRRPFGRGRACRGASHGGTPSKASKGRLDTDRWGNRPGACE